MTQTAPLDAAQLFASGEWLMVQRFVERAIGHGFKLAVIEVAAPRDRNAIIQALGAVANSGVTGVALDELPGENLWAELRAGFAHARLLALWGLNDSNGLARDRLIRQLNVQRDLFVRDLPMPWVLFVHPAAAIELRMLAPDFCDFAIIWLNANPPGLPEGLSLSPILAAAADAISDGRTEDAAALLSRYEQRSGLSVEERSKRALLQARLARIQGRTSDAESQLARAYELAGSDTALMAELKAERLRLGTTTTNVPLVYLLAVPEDLEFLRQMEAQLEPLQARGLLRVFADYHIPPGVSINNFVHAKLEEARLIVPLLSADLLANGRILALLERAIERQKAQQTTIVPVVLKSCLWQFSVLGESRPLPSDGQPVRAWRDRSAAWTDVVQGLLNALGSDVTVRPPAPPRLEAPSFSATASAFQPSIARHALLLVATPSEGRALMAELGAQKIIVEEDDCDGRYLDTFSLLNRNGDFRVIIGQSLEKGSHASQALVQDLVRAYHPEVVLLVGMCGGIAEHGARENSVLVARQVFNYEPARLREDQAVWSPTAYRTSARVTDLVNALIRRNMLPDVDILTNKDYASGEKLIDDLGSDLRQRILTYTDDIAGVEMEGQGMLHTLWELQRSGIVVQAGLIKGVCDLADGRQRDNKHWRQTEATRRAVRLALEILRRY